jgi:dihydroorotase
LKTQLKMAGHFCTSLGIQKKCVTFNSDSGLIENVENFDEGLHKKENIDFFYNEDCLIFSGMGDIHIHAREDASLKNIYKEDFHTTCCGAINGGVVHVGDMPNNPIPPIDDESYKEKTRISFREKIAFLMYGGIGPTTRPLSFSVPYKAYMGPSIGELYFKNNKELSDVLVHYKNQWVSFHCEDPEILEQNKNAKNHFDKRPIVAENMATQLALELIEKNQLTGKLCHYSSGEGLDLILAAKKKGLPVTCEVTPQHLFFSREKLEKDFSQDLIKFQMNPPIRGEEDRLRLLEALKNGDIDYLATDHAPHSQEEKEKGMSGLPGLDTYGPFVTWLLIDEKVDPKILAKITAENPGRFFNHFLPTLQEIFPEYKKWGSGLGFIEEGFSASFSVLNLKKPTTVTFNNIKTKARWSPFLGHTFKGSVEDVFIQGHRVTIENS